MQKPSYKIRQTYLFRLPPGEDLLVGLHRIRREYNILLGVFSVIGSVRNATLGHYDQQAGVTRRQALESSHDLVTCLGNISRQGDSFAIRTNAVLTDAQGQVTAGELLAAEIHVAEVYVQELQGTSLVRERDSETGQYLWPVS